MAIHVNYGCSVLKPSAPSNWFDSVLALAILTTWIGIVPLIVPVRLGDRGVFVSVGARLLAGDTLYSGVYENHDPLFYYFVAGQLALGRWAEVGAEALLIAIAAAATYFLAAKLASRWTAAAISYVAVPIILIGEFYRSGTELPGIALVLVIIAASAYGQSFLAGTCTGLLVFTKLIFVPIGLAGVVCFLLVRRRFFDVAAITLGASVSTILLVGVLAVRGELLPYIEIIRENIAYSQGSLIGSKIGLAALMEHIQRIGGLHLLWQEVVPILLALVLSLVALFGWHERPRMQFATAAACVATLVISLAVLGLTGLWYYHNQMLHIPAIIAVVGLTPLLDVASKRTRLMTLGLVTLMGCLMAGPISLAIGIDSFRNFPASYFALSELSPETRRLLAVGNSGTYARFGVGDNTGHAIGLGHWKLACPRFHQYPWQTAAVLNKAFECASNAPTLIISANFLSSTQLLEAGPSWNEFVARVNHLVENYSCDASAGLRICERPR